MIEIFLLYLNALSDQERLTFEKIFNRYSKYMYAIALAYHSNKYDAEDVIQEASIRLMKNLSKIKDIDSKETKGFISVVTRNVAIDKFNKDKNEIPSDEEWQFEQITTETSDFDIVNKETLKSYLKKIKQEDLHLLILDIVYGYNSREISDILALSSDAVRKRKSRAIRELKGLIEKGGDFIE